MSSINVVDLRAPLFTIEQVAVATGKSVNQVRHLHRSGQLEESKTLLGETFRPTGAILIPAQEVLRILVGSARNRFLAWQQGELEDLADVSR